MSPVSSELGGVKHARVGCKSLRHDRAHPRFNSATGVPGPETLLNPPRLRDVFHQLDTFWLPSYLQCSRRRSRHVCAAPWREPLQESNAPGTSPAISPPPEEPRENSHLVTSFRPACVDSNAPSSDCNSAIAPGGGGGSSLKWGCAIMRATTARPRPEYPRRLYNGKESTGGLPPWPCSKTSRFSAETPI